MINDVRQKHPPFAVRLQSASDSQATVEVVAADARPMTSVSGAIYGPQCEFARTLPARYPVESGKATIQEPCYWTPQLPFLYDVTLRDHPTSVVGATPANESAQRTIRRKVGIRRLAVRQQSLYWESRRIVLRGLCVGSLTIDLIHEARSAEVALMTVTPSEEQCDLTDRYGVPVIADMRGSGPDIEDICTLAHRPSVATILVDLHEVTPCDFAGFTQRPLVAVAHYPADGSLSSTATPHWSSAVAVEIDSLSRPPDWAANCGRPVIAIRRNATYADFHTARAACDRLQADLAPQFDLAGYFV